MARLTDRAQGPADSAHAPEPDTTRLEALTAAEQLQERTAFAESIIASAGEGVAVFDREMHYLVYNPVMESLTGVPAADVIGKKPADLFPSSMASGVGEAFARALAGETVSTAENEFIGPRSGRMNWTLGTYRPHRNARGEIVGVVAFFHDNTAQHETDAALHESQGDQRRAEKERAESQAQLRAVVDSTRDLIWSVDPVGYGLMTFNQAMSTHFQHDLKLRVKVGDRPRDIFPTEEAGHKWHTFYERALREGPFTTDYVTYAGTETLHLTFNVLHWGGSAFGVSVFGRDVTEQRQAEQALRKSEERFRTLFENAAEAVVINDEQGHFLDANEQACAKLGYTKEELLGMTASQIDTPRFAEGLPDRTARLLRDGIISFESEHVARDGTIFPSETTASIIELDGKRAILAMVRDLTEKRRAEAERAGLEEQLRQAQKVEEIGRLAGGIAHDFNNLLTAIRGNASLALASLPEGEGPREDLEQIEEAADRAAALTRQLLAFARRTILQPEVVDLGAIVRHVEPMLHRLIGEDVALVTNTTETGSVLADPGQLEQVIVNLSVNARDAMPEGGTITIRTACPSEGADGPGVVTLSVSDTGVGMNDETMSHLFEPFFTTKSVGKGTGLGLPTIYGIVRQSGGTVAVSSRPGEGSTFTIRLPRVEAANAVIPSPQGASTQTKTRSGTILVVEDDSGVRRFVCRVLEAAGYTVLEAGGGEEALEVARSAQIHLLLTDVVMPGMRGKEVATRITAGHPLSKVLYISGHTDISIVNAGVLEAGIAFLAKPFTSQALLEAVDAMFEPAMAD
jgi:PAS domain S-box-containing protein